MARVVLVSQYYPPEITAAAFRLAALQELLRQLGHDVLVITAYPHKTNWLTPMSRDREVVRLRLHREPRSARARLLHQALFMVKVIGQLPHVRRWNPDYIIASSPPLPVAIAGLVLSRLQRLPHILDLRDIWPGSAAAAGVTASDTGLYRLATRLERWVYRNSQWIMTVSQPMAEYVGQYVDLARVRVVYNGVSGRPPCSRFRGDRSRSRTSLCLAYAGNVGLVQGLEVLPAAISMLPDRVRRRFIVRIIGAGPRLDALRTEVERLGLQDVFTFEGPYPVEVLHEVICSQVDALFLHLKDDPVLRLTIPSKLFDYLMYGLPIVYGLSGEGADWLERRPGTIRFRQGSPEALRHALLQLLDRYPSLASQARANEHFVLSRFNRERCFAPYREVLSK